MSQQNQSGQTGKDQSGQSQGSEYEKGQPGQVGTGEGGQFEKGQPPQIGPDAPEGGEDEPSTSPSKPSQR